jgi:hypothetical protein
MQDSLSHQLLAQLVRLERVESSNSTQVLAAINALLPGINGSNASLNDIEAVLENNYMMPKGAKSSRVTAKAGVGKPTVIQYWSESGFTGTLLTTATIVYDVDGDFESISYS